MLNYTDRFLAMPKTAPFREELLVIRKALQDNVVLPKLEELCDLELELLHRAADEFLSETFVPVSFNKDIEYRSHDYFLCHVLCDVVRREDLNREVLRGLLNKINIGLGAENTISDALISKQHGGLLRCHLDTTFDESVSHYTLGDMRDNQNIVLWVNFVTLDGERVYSDVHGYVQAMLRMMWLDELTTPKGQDQ